MVTVLFADLVGFTGLSEERDPEQLKHLIDRCFGRLVADVTAFGGTVDKIIGDAIVALFGAPVAHEDDAERAVRAALRMQQTLSSFAQEQDAELRMRVGVNTGEVLVGALRAGGDYTAMGDTVNVAARLQALAAPGEVLVGPATAAATRAAIGYESRGDTDLRGRDHSVEVFAATGEIAPPGRRRQPTRSGLVGRETELAHLRAAVDTAVSRSRAHLINILGEAGVGKTRLAEETAALAEADHGALVFDGRVLPYGETNPLRALGEAFAGAAGVTPGAGDQEAVRLVRAMVDPVLDVDVDLDPGVGEAVVQSMLRVMGRPSTLDSLDPPRRLQELTEGFRRFFLAATSRGPVVVVLGDIKWADERLLTVCEALLRSLVARPFVLVVTARWTIDEYRWVMPPGRHNALVLNLDPLDQGASTRLVDELAGGWAPAEVAEQLFDRSGGNPFYLEEMVSLLREAGVVGPEGIGGDVGRAAARLPDNLRGLVAARLDALAPHERAMVDTASILGRRGSVYLLHAMVGDDDGGQATFRHLVDKDIFATEAEGWRFRSEVVQEVAYGMLTRAVRADKHYRVAEWLVAHSGAAGGDDIGVIADHFGSAAELVPAEGLTGVPRDVIDTAVEWLGRAGVEADARDSHHTAAQRFRRAVDLLKADDPRLAELLVGRARARLGLRDLAAARTDAIEAGRLAELRDDPVGVAVARRVEGEIATTAGDFGAAADLLEDSIARFAELGDTGGGAEALRLRGMAAMGAGDADLADRYIEHARQVFVDLDDQAGVAWCLQNLAWTAFERGMIDEAEARLDRALELFSAQDNRAGLAFARSLQAFLLFHGGHPQQAEALALEVREVVHGRGELFDEAMMELLLASIALWDGRARTAADMAQEAQAVFESIESEFGAVQALGLLGRAHAALGELAASRSALAECRRRADQMRGRPLAAFARLVAAGGAVQVGEPDVALEHLAATDPGYGERAMIGSVDLRVTRGLATLQRGEVAAALAMLKELESDAAAQGTYLDSTLAMCLVAADRLDEAESHAGRVLADGRATYLDRRTAMLAAAFAAVRRGVPVEAAERFGRATAAVDATESRTSQAIVRLAEAVGYEVLGHPDARARAAAAREALTSLDLDPVGWERAFRLAAGSLESDNVIGHG